jgi:hypothetical protein
MYITRNQDNLIYGWTKTEYIVNIPLKFQKIEPEKNIIYKVHFRADRNRQRDRDRQRQRQRPETYTETGNERKREKGRSISR